MADSRLDDLGRRIDACMRKHGIVPYRERLVVSFRVDFSAFKDAMTRASYSIDVYLAAMEQVRKAVPHG